MTSCGYNPPIDDADPKEEADESLKRALIELSDKGALASHQHIKNVTNRAWQRIHELETEVWDMYERIKVLEGDQS